MYSAEHDTVQKGARAAETCSSACAAAAAAAVGVAPTNTTTFSAPIKNIINEMDDQRKAILLGEARYAERLTRRTARLYRRIAWACAFLGVVGGSGVVSALSMRVPDWVSVTGAVILMMVAAVTLTVRPVEKAVANETDARKYAALRTAAGPMSADEFQSALNKARETDTAEIEPLREVAYNDIVTEIGRADLKAPLRVGQRLLGALA